MIVRCCPHCYSLSVRRSRPQSLAEGVLLALVLLRPYRCEKCKRRFHGSVFAKKLPLGGEGAGVAPVGLEGGAEAAVRER